MSSGLNRFEKKKIAILGLGLENIALMRFLLEKKVSCELIICDAKKKKELGDKIKEFKDIKNIKWQLGQGHDKHFNDFDMISRVAGYPLFSPALIQAKQAGADITSPTKLFFELSPTKNIIGVTGSKGKGTTSGLIYEILKTARQSVYWGGNIGIPMFGCFEKLKKDDWVVLELSSFQLEDLHVSPQIAVITNLFKEHLKPADPANPNYHKSMAQYVGAKFNIVKFQKRGDIAIINKKIQATYFKTKSVEATGKAKKIYFNKSDLPTRLVGEHNQENIAAAVTVAKQLGVRDALIKKTVKKFKGLTHRIELVGEARGIRYYDDSFGTTPESTIIAMRSFDSPIILLAGGADKGSNFQKMAVEIKKRVKFSVLLQGKSTPRIKKELTRINYPSKQMELVHSMPEAMQLANQKASSGDIVLLSTGCASFGMFNNYKERGDLFKQEVKKLM